MIWLLLTVAMAMNEWQMLVARKVMEFRHVPAFSIVVSGPIFQELAFTDMVSHKVYVDASRFVNASNTWTNVMIHESGHLLGAQHGDGSLGMQYMVTVNPNGEIIDDEYLLADISGANPSFLSPVSPPLFV